MKKNRALARLREGRPINGAAIVYDSPSMVEQAALARGHRIGFKVDIR